MADPNYPISCLQGQWTKIATNIVSGQVWRMDEKALYYHTYRLTGEAAPTEFNEGTQIFEDNDSEIIDQKSEEPIDVYIWCKNNDGIVRVDV